MAESVVITLQVEVSPDADANAIAKSLIEYAEDLVGVEYVEEVFDND